MMRARRFVAAQARVLSASLVAVTESAQNLQRVPATGASRATAQQ
jgi:hypothetical protein